MKLKNSPKGRLQARSSQGGLRAGSCKRQWEDEMIRMLHNATGGNERSINIFKHHLRKANGWMAEIRRTNPQSLWILWMLPLTNPLKGENHAKNCLELGYIHQKRARPTSSNKLANFNCDTACFLLHTPAQSCQNSFSCLDPVSDLSGSHLTIPAI